MIASLVLLVGVPVSWGQPSWNPTASDAAGNTAGGTQALDAAPASFGSFSTAFGYQALFANTTGGDNTATGAGALRSNTTSSFNTATGAFALYHNTTGYANTITGYNALSTNTTGGYNTATGVHALRSNVIGSWNTALGHLALENSTGGRNIAVGQGAGAALTSGNKNIYLGHPGESSESKTMRLGSAQTRAFIAGVAGTGVTGTNVVIDANGQLGVALSSARYKRDIEPLGARSRGLLQLRPVTFVYTNDRQGARQYGLIAEEVAAVYPELVTRTATGDVQSVRYQDLIPLLLAELQRQQQELEALRALVARKPAAERAKTPPARRSASVATVSRAAKSPVSQ
jgi:hypothetical protein